MHVKYIFTILFILAFSIFGYGQTFTYSYTDPCTGSLKSLQVPSNGITVNYYGEIQTFQPNDFYNGSFESWTQNVYSNYGGDNPCATIVGLSSTVNIAQNTAINFIGIVNSLSALSDMASGSTNILSGVGSIQSSPTSNGTKKKDRANSNNSSSPGNQSPGGSQNQGNNNANNNNSTPISGNSGSSNSTSSQSSGSGTSQTSGTETTQTSGENQETTTNGSTTQGSNNPNGSGGSGEGGNGQSESASTTETEEGGETNLVGGSVSSVQGSSGSGSPTNKNGNRPTILASSDFVGFNFKNSDVTAGGKVTGGYASMRWDSKRSWGINADYTTAIKGPNITAFYAFIGKKRIDLISTSLTLGFDRKTSAYGTLALGQMWNLGKKGKFKAVYMLTGSYGNVYGEEFIGIAAIAGTMYDFRISKRIEVKVLGLYVYAPYVSYYNDVLLKSPHVVLPIVGTNIGLSKRFKLNINCGGAWALQKNALNYTVMIGTRMLL